MLSIVAPGQGAQKPGFLAPWLESSAFATRLGGLSEAAEIDLAHYGTEADAEQIRDTAVAQPLLVAASLATALELFDDVDDLCARAGVVAGHSVGEFAAAATAGVLSPSDAVVLVRERGRAMAEASAVRPTSMAAVIGGDADEVLARLAELGLTPANNNGTGQIVAAGTVEQLDELRATPPARARIIPLSVAGAFHTEHMAPAVEHLRETAASVTAHDPATRLLSNRDGQVVASGSEYVQRLVSQVANPVRWDLCMTTLLDLGVTGMIELAPAGTLTGIAKRQMKGVEVFNLNTPDQLDAARDFVAAHAG